jgi:hypothetical protein
MEIDPPLHILLSDPKALPYLVRFVNATEKFEETHGTLKLKTDSVYKERRFVESFDAPSQTTHHPQ